MPTTSAAPRGEVRAGPGMGLGGHGANSPPLIKVGRVDADLDSIEFDRRRTRALKRAPIDAGKPRQIYAEQHASGAASRRSTSIDRSHCIPWLAGVRAIPTHGGEQ